MEAAAFQRKVKNLESSHDHNGLGLELDAIKNRCKYCSVGTVVRGSDDSIMECPAFKRRHSHFSQRNLIWAGAKNRASRESFGLVAP